MGRLSDAPEVQAALALIRFIVEKQRLDVGIPGLSVAIVVDQETVWAEGFGHADPQKKIKADSKTAYCVASVTKLFTATMLMQLRDKGKLSLDDTIEKFLPKVNVKSGFGDSRPASFREIASHTSGLPQEALSDHWKEMKFPSIEQMLESLSRTEKIHPELTEIHYSNLGIALMACALERVAGQRWEDYVLENILKPLEMDHSGFTSTPERLANRAVGHRILKNKSVEVVPEFALGSYVPVGGLWSCAEDLAQFMSFQFRDQNPDCKRILGRTSVREMLTPVFLDPEWKSGFGIGWMLEREGNRTVAWHSGGIPGFRAYMAIVPDKKVGVVVLANAHTKLENLMGMSKYVLDTITPIAQRASKKPEEGRKTMPEWEKYRGRYHFLEMAEIEAHIIDGKLTLVAVGYPPSSWSTLEPEGANGFRVKGGDDNGELAVFETDNDGNVTGLRIGGFPYARV